MEASNLSRGDRIFFRHEIMNPKDRSVMTIIGTDRLSETVDIRCEDGHIIYGVPYFTLRAACLYYNGPL